MDIGIVVAVNLLLFLCSPASQWLSDIAVGVFAADHETNLARWVGWDRSVGVLNRGEYFFAILLQLSDEWEVEPLILSCVS